MSKCDSAPCGSLDEIDEAGRFAPSAETEALDAPDRTEQQRVVDGGQKQGSERQDGGRCDGPQSASRKDEGGRGYGADDVGAGRGDLERGRGVQVGEGCGGEGGPGAEPARVFGPRELHLRVGIHTGEVASGVVGIHVPRFKLFGETVCAAARLEASGSSGRVHCSRETAEILAEYGYEMESRGAIALKGLQNMSSFWVLDVPEDVQGRVEEVVASARRELDSLRAYKGQVRVCFTHIHACSRMRHLHVSSR